MQRVGILNGENITYDKDLSEYFLNFATTGIISGLLVETNVVRTGKAIIKATRTNGEEIAVVFENTSDVTIDTSIDSKVFIELNQSNIDDGINNNEDGTGIGEIKTATSFPTSNYIPLASIISGTITDLRKIINLKSISGIIESEVDVEIKNANGNLKKINTSEVLINGNAMNSAGGVVKLGPDGKVEAINLPVASNDNYISLEQPIVGNIGDRELVAKDLTPEIIISQIETGATFTDSVLISTNKIAITYYIPTGSIQKVVVADITDPKNPIYGTPFVLHSGLVLIETSQPTLEKISDNKFIVIYNKSAENWGAIFTTVGTTLTVGDNKSFELLYNRFGFASNAVLIDTDRIAVFGSNGATYISGIVLTIVGTTFTIGVLKYPVTNLTVNGQKCYLRVEKLNTNEVILVFQTGNSTDASNVLYGYTCTIIGDTFTLGTLKQIQIGKRTGWLDILVISSTEVKLVYGSQYGNSTYLHTLTIAGTTITSTLIGNLSTTSTTYQSKHRLYNDNGTIKYVLVYGSTLEMYIGEFLSGTNPPIRIISGTYDINNLSLIDTNGLIILNSANNLYLEKSFIYKKAGLYSVDKKNIIGFSVGAFTDGQICKIAIDGVLDGFIGLEPRKLYKLSTTIAGNIELVGGTETTVITDYLLCRAISSTEVKILIYNVNNNYNY